MTGVYFTRRAFAGIGAGAMLAVAAFAYPVSAQMAQVNLTSASVQAFIASYPGVKATAAKLQKTYGSPGAGQSGDPAAAWGAWLAVSAAQGALDASVKAHGFDSFASWMEVLTSVATAYGFAKGGDQISAGMASAAKQIEDSKTLSDDQKKMMMQQLQASMGSISAAAPPQGNIDAVQPYLDQLAALFK